MSTLHIEPQWAVGKSPEEILDKIAKSLRVSLATPIHYGYDAVDDRYFINAPEHKGAYIDFMGKFLRNYRWDVIGGIICLLEELVTGKKTEGGVKEYEYE